MGIALLMMQLYFMPLQDCQIITEAYLQANPGLSNERALDLALLTAQASYTFHVDPLLAAGMLITESHLKQKQISCCGALGYGQVRWEIWGNTLQKYGIAHSKEDLLTNDRASIYAPIYVLRHLIVRYHGDLERALKAYSGGAREYKRKATRLMNERGVIRF